MNSARQDPIVSVVMPVHNAMPHLDAAIQSILDQTFADFEFIIFDDGSTDGSTERLREWAARDSRIRLSHSKVNLGPVGSSRAVVEMASCPLIARMDADDISLPTRLEKQLLLLRQRPDVGLVACACDVIGADGNAVRGPDLWRLARKSWFAPFAHGSAMFHRDLFDAAGGYRDACVYWEDQAANPDHNRLAESRRGRIRSATIR
jgi:glycosyltransferase involved in cell wall biosynthesis